MSYITDFHVHLALKAANNEAIKNAVAGGTGTVFFDDIRLYRPAP